MRALANSLGHYCDYLKAQCKEVKLNHVFATPVCSLPDSICVKFVKPCTRYQCLIQLNELNRALESLKSNKSMCFSMIMLSKIQVGDMTFCRVYNEVANVHVRDLVCKEPAERLYNTSKYSSICVHCACSLEIDFNTDQSHFYPQCSGCQKPIIPVC